MKNLIFITLLIGMIGSAKSQEVTWNYDIEVNYVFAQPSTDFMNRKIIIFHDTVKVSFNVDTMEFMGVKFTPEDVLKWKSANTPTNSIFSGITSTTVYTITHGLGYTPSAVFLQPRSDDAAERHYYISNITATTFDIVFTVAPATGTNNLIFDWFAIK